MYPRNTANAKRGYAKRELKRKQARKEASAGWKPINQEIITPKEGKMKKSEKIALIAGAILLTALCVGSLIFFGKVLKPAVENFVTEFNQPQEPPVVNVYIPTQVAIEAPVVQPTEVPVASESMVQVEVPTGPVLVSEPNPTCPVWDPSANVTQMLPPGQTAIGDVVVDDIIRYDVGGKGESTIVVNMSSKEVKIFAEWGSGCEFTTDFRSVVNKQFPAGCGNADGDKYVDTCGSVRFVLVTDQGTTETFYIAPIK